MSCTTLHPGFVASEITSVDNEGKLHPEQADPRPKKLIWPTNKAAKVMVKAVLKRKRIYIFTTHGKVLVWLQRLFPGLIRLIISKGPKPDS